MNIFCEEVWLNLRFATGVYGTLKKTWLRIEKVCRSFILLYIKFELYFFVFTFLSGGLDKIYFLLFPCPFEQPCLNLNAYKTYLLLYGYWFVAITPIGILDVFFFLSLYSFLALFPTYHWMNGMEQKQHSTANELRLDNKTSSGCTWPELRSARVIHHSSEGGLWAGPDGGGKGWGWGGCKGWSEVFPRIVFTVINRFLKCSWNLFVE